MKAASIPFFFFDIIVCPNSVKVRIWSRHPLPLLKPPWSSANDCLSSTTFTSLSWTIKHIALYTTDTKNMPRNSSVQHVPLLLVFGIGTTMLRVHIDGTIPLPSTNWTVPSKALLTPLFIICAVMPSFPAAAFIFNFWGAYITSSLVMHSLNKPFPSPMNLSLPSCISSVISSPPLTISSKRSFHTATASLPILTTPCQPCQHPLGPLDDVYRSHRTLYLDSWHWTVYSG